MMVYLYVHLFHTDLEIYYPFLVAGMLSWTLISVALMELIDTLMGAESMIKQIKLPYTLYIHRVITRNILIFFHNVLVIIPILIVFHKVAKINWNTLLLIPGLFIVYVNALFFGLLVSMIGARFRDVSQIMKSLIQILFFLTPIMWKPEVLPPAKAYLVQLNPFYAFTEMLRAPMMGQVPTAENLWVVAITTVIGIALCYKVFARYRARIVYWL
jgi:lipopolysaccharide transport system permease protein